MSSKSNAIVCCFQNARGQWTNKKAFILFSKHMIFTDSFVEPNSHYQVKSLLQHRVWLLTEPTGVSTEGRGFMHYNKNWQYNKRGQ